MVSEDSSFKSQVNGAAESHQLSSLILFPAIDIAEGKSVRVSFGDHDAQESFGSPLEIAAAWIESGTDWIHLVDLDAAFGKGENHALLSQVVAACSSIKVQVSGGIRDHESFSSALKTGVDRVNLATSALSNLEWVKSLIAEHGTKIAVALDVSGTRLVARGTKEDVGDLTEVLKFLEDSGCARYIVTDVSKDGSLEGPNLELLDLVLNQTSKPIIASGGISAVTDIERLRARVPSGLEGAILGKALYVGRFTLEQALEAAKL